VNLLIVDELGYVPFTAVGSELLFEAFSRRYEQDATLVTGNLPFDEWTGVFGSERLTGALLDRLTHHLHILEMNGERYRLATSKKRARKSAALTPADDSHHGPLEQEGGANTKDCFAPPCLGHLARLGFAYCPRQGKTPAVTIGLSEPALRTDWRPFTPPRWFPIVPPFTIKFPRP